MAGRTSPNEGIDYILEPTKHNINLNKCIFFIISITPAGSQGLHRSGRENIELPNDLIDISNLIEIFSEEPFLIPEDKIKVFVNVEESEKIYFELIKASRNKDIENIINSSSLKDKVKQLSLDMFMRVAKAEAKVHGKTLYEVHFHEVGAIDSIIDMVGAAICIDYLEVDKIIASPVALYLSIDTQYS